MKLKNIFILGIGNLLYSDEGFGVHVIRYLLDRYEFSENVTVIDGGVLGMNLLGIVNEADYLVVVDVIRNHGNPGDVYRIPHEAIPSRIRAKNSLHQIDFLEALTLCRVMDKVPETVIIGVEPADIDTLGLELTPIVQSRMGLIAEMAIKEVIQQGGSYQQKRTDVETSHSYSLH